MTDFSFYSKAEERRITFSVPGAGTTGTGYVFVDLNHREGALGCQICKGGRLRGDTLMASAATLEAVARRWWRQYLRNPEYVR